VIPAVIYGVKSSPDEKEAVADQHRIVRKAIGDDERIIGAYGEEKQSGYRKERGPQLEAAIRVAIDAAAEHGGAELWVWHSSRLARGDGTKGKRSIQKVVSDLLYAGVTVRSATDPEMITPMLAGIASAVSNKYSEDLSTWTKTGLERRRRRGDPLGAVPFGFKVERKIVADRVISRRVVDSTLAPVVQAIFERVANGTTLGAIARWLNAEGITTRRDTAFVARSIRKIIENDAYEGQKGYPAIVDAALVQEARATLGRRDPAAVQRRKGGRPAADYMLRGIVFCAGCGAPLYSSRSYLNGRCGYVCSHKLQATGLCSRPAIPAKLLEGHVLNHLGSFVGSVEGWIQERVAERNSEAQGRQRQLDAERTQLAALDRQREVRMAEIVKHGITSPVAFEVVERIDRQRDAQAARIAEAEAMLGEWSGPPDVDAALDYYNALVDTIQGRIQNANSAREMNEALAGIVAGLWCELDPDSEYKRLLVRFALRVPTTLKLPDGSVSPDQQLWLPPATVGSLQAIEPLDVSQTGHFTTVSVCCP